MCVEKGVHFAVSVMELWKAGGIFPVNNYCFVFVWPFRLYLRVFEGVDIVET